MNERKIRATQYLIDEGFRVGTPMFEDLLSKLLEFSQKEVLAETASLRREPEEAKAEIERLLEQSIVTDDRNSEE